MKGPRVSRVRSMPAAAPEPGFWLTTFLFAIPFGFVATLIGTAVTATVSLAQSGDAANAGDYGNALLSSIVISLLLFVGFCYLIVPIATVVLALLRLICRSVAARQSNLVAAE